MLHDKPFSNTFKPLFQWIDFPQQLTANLLKNILSQITDKSGSDSVMDKTLMHLWL